jgi:hypothetical protein
MTRLVACCAVLALLAVGSGCGDDGAPFVPQEYGQWLPFEPEGAVCANGSQYKYFINFSETSDNVVIFFEGGGACWNYEDCANGRPFNTECIKEPEGTECIRDDYPAVYLHLDELEGLNAQTEPLGVVNGDVPVELAYPMLSSDPAISPMADWNKVFVTYCTGDTYLGNVVRTYTDPEGVGPDVEFHHMGHQNTLLVIEDLNRMFKNVPKMMVSGCSAGGVGSLSNYAFLRDGLPGAQSAYLISDSGPVIPSKLLDGEPSHSTALYEQIRSTWGVDATINAFPMESERILADFGELNAVLAEMFPNDRLSMSMFERDYNVTVNSYEDFFPIFAQPESSVDTAAGRTEIYRLASEDLAALRARLDELDNFAYYMPYYRNTNDSHCLTVTGLEDVGSSAFDFISAFQSDPSTATWAGTEIETNGVRVTFKDQIENVLDDSVRLQSHYEGTCEGKFQVCALDCAAYDAATCEAVVGQ